MKKVFIFIKMLKIFTLKASSFFAILTIVAEKLPKFLTSWIAKGAYN